MAEQLHDCSFHMRVRVATCGTHACSPAPQLVNYPAYRDHEVKAMWEWLRRTGRKLEVIGMMGPLQQVGAGCRPCMFSQTNMHRGARETGHRVCVKRRISAGKRRTSSFCAAIETAEARRCDGPQPAVRPGRLPAVSRLHCVVKHPGAGMQQPADGVHQRI